MNFRGGFAQRRRHTALAAWLLIAVVLVAVAPARASGPETANEGDVQSGQAADSAHGLWDILFKTRVNDLAAIEIGRASCRERVF